MPLWKTQKAKSLSEMEQVEYLFLPYRRCDDQTWAFQRTLL